MELESLLVRNGSFAFIWFAGNGGLNHKAKKIQYRNEILDINVSEKCDELGYHLRNLKEHSGFRFMQTVGTLIHGLVLILSLKVEIWIGQSSTDLERWKDHEESKLELDLDRPVPFDEEIDWNRAYEEMELELAVGDGWPAGMMSYQEYSREATPEKSLADEDKEPPRKRKRKNRPVSLVLDSTPDRNTIIEDSLPPQPPLITPPFDDDPSVGIFKDSTPDATPLQSSEVNITPRRPQRPWPQSRMILSPLIPEIAPAPRKPKPLKKLLFDKKIIIPAQEFLSRIQANSRITIDELMAQNNAHIRKLPEARPALGCIGPCGRKILSGRLKEVITEILNRSSREDIEKIRQAEKSSRNETGDSAAVAEPQPNSDSLGIEKTKSPSMSKMNRFEEENVVEIHAIPSPERNDMDDSGVTQEETVDFLQIVPWTTIKRTAARKFVALLTEHKNRSIELIQHEFCGTLTIRIPPNSPFNPTSF